MTGDQRMLTITVESTEYYNESTEEFESQEEVVIHLEHSLVSLSKWESKWEKPFLEPNDKSPDEILSYIECMITDEKYPEGVVYKLNDNHVQLINAYIESKQTATTFGQMPDKKVRGETITSELIYYWLIAFNIPFECETWHLNRLFSLIRVCNIKNSPKQKMSKHEMAMRNRELNAKRRQELGTSG